MNDVLLVAYGLTLTPWKLIGLLGACLFTARWFVQLYATKRLKRVVMPMVAWRNTSASSSDLKTRFSRADTLFACSADAPHNRTAISRSLRMPAKSPARSCALILPTHAGNSPGRPDGAFIDNTITEACRPVASVSAAS